MVVVVDMIVALNRLLSRFVNIQGWLDMVHVQAKGISLSRDYVRHCHSGVTGLFLMGTALWSIKIFEEH